MVRQKQLCAQITQQLQAAMSQAGFYPDSTLSQHLQSIMSCVTLLQQDVPQTVQPQQVAMSSMPQSASASRVSAPYNVQRPESTTGLSAGPRATATDLTPNLPRALSHQDNGLMNDNELLEFFADNPFPE
jgi:hypothetical protein